MRKKMLVMAAIVGGVAGGTIAFEDGVGVQLVLAALGVVVGSALGGFVSRIVGGRARSERRDCDSDGLAPSQRALNDDYWIDRGHLKAAPGQARAEDSDIQW